MSSTCFETKGSSSGRRLYIQVWYGIHALVWAVSEVEECVRYFYSIEHTVLSTILFILMHVKHTITFFLFNCCK